MPKGVYPRRPVLERFWAKVDKRGPDECWPWTGGVSDFGYGAFTINGKLIGAHRFALQLHIGRALLPDELACHGCDNPPCCNAQHLFVGTHGDNTRDAAAKGRLAAGDDHFRRLRPDLVHRGEQHANSKLTTAVVAAIFAAKAAGTKQIEIARSLNIAPSTVCGVLKRRSWRHVCV